MASDKFLITHYHLKIPLLKRIFYYGSYSRNDLDQAGDCGSSKYYADIKPIQYAFGDLLEEHTNSAGEKAYRLRHNYFEDPQRLLMKYFALKSIDTDKLCVSLFVLQSLCGRHSEPMSFDELRAKVELTGFLYVSEETLRKWINDLAEYGFLSKKGRQYDIVDRLLCKGVLDKETRDKLLLLTDFCSNVLPLAICGGGIRTKLDMLYRTPFLFKHSYPGRILDDETLWKLLVYIQNRQPICFTYLEPNDTVKEHQAPFLPYRIISDKASGRQYLFVVCLQGNSRVPYLLRIDKILAFRTADNPSVIIPDDEELEKIYADALRLSFSGINIPRNKKKPPKTGRLVFHNDAQREILRRFPDAVIAPVDETHSSTEIEVYNLDELKPWLRTHINRIRLTESSDGTARELEKELEEWRMMYDVR